MIEIKGVKKSFGENHILKGVDLDIKDGEVIVILGPSGSGKTTFLRCISFLEKADEGKWIENGAEIDLYSADKKQIQQLRRKSGFVFQNYNLFANKTVLENVTMGLTVGEGVPKDEAEKRAMEALKKVGMADRANFYPNALSGGQQQRVGIARAIARNPELILCQGSGNQGCLYGWRQCHRTGTAGGNLCFTNPGENKTVPQPLFTGIYL